MDAALQNAVLTGRYAITETPEVIKTAGNCFRYFKESGTLLVSTPDFTDKVNGRVRMGKSVAIRLETLISEPAALKALYRVLGDCRDKVDKETWANMK